jgi:hypothetical protein
MRLGDAWLLWKKILVGLIVTIVPLAILASGLWLTQRFAGSHARSKQDSTKQVTYAN